MFQMILIGLSIIQVVALVVAIGALPTLYRSEAKKENRHESA